MGMKELYLKYRGESDPVAAIMKDFHWERDAAAHNWERLKERYSEMVKAEVSKFGGKMPQNAAEQARMDKSSSEAQDASDGKIEAFTAERDSAGRVLQTRALYEYLKQQKNPVDEMTNVCGYKNKDVSWVMWKKLRNRYEAVNGSEKPHKACEQPKMDKSPSNSKTAHTSKIKANTSKLKMKVAEGDALRFVFRDDVIEIRVVGSSMEHITVKIADIRAAIEDMEALMEVVG